MHQIISVSSADQTLKTPLGSTRQSPGFTFEERRKLSIFFLYQNRVWCKKIQSFCWRITITILALKLGGFPENWQGWQPCSQRCFYKTRETREVYILIMLVSKCLVMSLQHFTHLNKWLVLLTQRRQRPLWHFKSSHIQIQQQVSHCGTLWLPLTQTMNFMFH